MKKRTHRELRRRLENLLRPYHDGLYPRLVRRMLEAEGFTSWQVSLAAQRVARYEGGRWILLPYGERTPVKRKCDRRAELWRPRAADGKFVSFAARRRAA